MICEQALFERELDDYLDYLEAKREERELCLVL